MVSSMNEIAHSLKLKTVAEYVETEVQASKLMKPASTIAGTLHRAGKTGFRISTKISRKA